MILHVKNLFLEIIRFFFLGGGLAMYLFVHFIQRFFLFKRHVSVLFNPIYLLHEWHDPKHTFFTCYKWNTCGWQRFFCSKDGFIHRLLIKILTRLLDPKINLQLKFNLRTFCKLTLHFVMLNHFKMAKILIKIKKWAKSNRLTAMK